MFDASGQAIYILDVDGTSAPRCYDECEEAWPPVLTEGDPVADDGTTASLLGTTRRTDGIRPRSRSVPGLVDTPGLMVLGPRATHEVAKQRLDGKEVPDLSDATSTTTSTAVLEEGRALYGDDPQWHRITITMGSAAGTDPAITYQTEATDDLCPLDLYRTMSILASR